MISIPGSGKLQGNSRLLIFLIHFAHHEGAIAMAEAEIGHGNNLELKKMALKIMTDQKKEIA